MKEAIKRYTALSIMGSGMMFCEILYMEHKSCKQLMERLQQNKQIDSRLCNDIKTLNERILFIGVETPKDCKEYYKLNPTTND